MEAAQKDLSVLQCSYEDEEILTVALGIFKPHIEVDAIRPDVLALNRIRLKFVPSTGFDYNSLNINGLTSIKLFLFFS